MNRKIVARTSALMIIFCVACAIFAVRLFGLQIINRKKYAPVESDVLFTRIETVEAQRGSLCDRNGKVLVRNEYSYDLVVDYYSLPYEVEEENAALLDMYYLTVEHGYEPILIENFPLTGTYPNMVYAEGEEAAAIREAIIDRYGRRDSIDAPALAKYLANRYDLIDLDGNLKVAPEEVLIIMKLRWSLIADDFYNNGSYTLARDIDLGLITVVNKSEMAGARVALNSERVYVYPGYASHLLGQVGKIYAEDWEEYKAKGYSMDALVGISGCEKIFEDSLRGIDGEKVVEYDSNGVIINEYIKTEPIAGRDVWLTIDIDLQIAAEDGLRDNLDYVHEKATGNLTGEDATAAALTMVQVDTGQVLAMASYPTYDLTTYNEDYDALKSAEVSPLVNRAINGVYAPGSTFKVGVSIAALGEGIIAPDTLIHTTGKYTYFSSYQPRCWLYTSTGRSHGSINVSEALRVSCNCFYYEVGRRLGIDKLNEYCRLFGLGEDTGFELGGELGILAGPAYRNTYGLAEWQETDTIVASIGQSENLFSPLQINMYIAAVANGGTRYAATLFYAEKDFGADESAVSAAEPKVLSTFKFHPYHHSVILDAMEEMVDTSATAAAMFRKVPVKVGGKSGTAQVGTTKSENALFVAVAPADDPEIAAVCVIEQGHAGTYSSYAISEVFEAYYGVD